MGIEEVDTGAMTVERRLRGRDSSAGAQDMATIQDPSKSYLSPIRSLFHFISDLLVIVSRPFTLHRQRKQNGCIDTNIEETLSSSLQRRLSRGGFTLYGCKPLVHEFSVRARGGMYSAVLNGNALGNHLPSAESGSLHSAYNSFCVDEERVSTCFEYVCNNSSETREKAEKAQRYVTVKQAEERG